jgi:high-affinity Fe2+/Pb2+ permease
MKKTIENIGVGFIAVIAALTLGVVAFFGWMSVRFIWFFFYTGITLAIAKSMVTWDHFGWAIIHGMLGWVYVLYAALVY